MCISNVYCSVKEDNYMCNFNIKMYLPFICNIKMCTNHLKVTVCILLYMYLVQTCSFVMYMYIVHTLSFVMYMYTCTCTLYTHSLS